MLKLMRAFATVKATEPLLHSRHGEGQEDEENVVFGFKKIKQVDRKA